MKSGEEIKGSKDRVTKRSAFDVLCAQGRKKPCRPKPAHQGWIDLGRNCTIGYFPRHLEKAVSDACFQVCGAQPAHLHLTTTTLAHIHVVDHECSCLQDLFKTAPWQESEIVVFGAPVMQPRRLCYMSDDTTLQYSYSGAKDIKVQPWHAAVLPLKVCISLIFCGRVVRILTCLSLLNVNSQEIAEDLVGTTFNSCLLNLYRDGKDYVGWHADDEKLYGKNAPICSISLGHARDFQLRLKADKSHKLQYSLGHGDLFVMKGELQTYWQHQVPKRITVGHPRINLTFRVAKLPCLGSSTCK